MQIKNVGEKLNKSITQDNADSDSDTSQSNEKQEKIVEKEFQNNKIYNKDDASNKKENDNDFLNTNNPKEKNIIDLDLSDDEKVVFSQLGINPLITLGKEYLTSNNFVRLKENNSDGEKNNLNNKKIKAKKVPKSKDKDEIESNNKGEINLIDKSTKDNNEIEEVLISDNNNEIELTDETNNARKKRRRSSASM